MGVLALLLFSQDNKAVDDAGNKALAFIKSPPKRSWARFLENSLSGLAYMAHGSTTKTGDYAAELKACVDASLIDTSAGEPELVHWNYALILLFLSEVHKKEPSAQLKTRCEALVKSLAEAQEANGAWQRKKGWSYPYGKGCPDISILGGVVMAALGNAKSGGIEVPDATLNKAFEYFKRISDGQGGLCYGTNNEVEDFCNSRAAGALIGMHFMNKKDELYNGFAKGLQNRYKFVHQGHDAPYLHYLLTAVGCYLLGSFDAWKKEHLQRVLAAREPDGSIWFTNAENDPYERRTLQVNIASTAVLAIICNLHKGNIFNPNKPEPPKPAPKKRKR